MMNLGHILLIDDDQAANFYHKLLIRRLEKQASIHIATNGKEAEQEINKIAKDYTAKRPLLILLDLNMPIQDGFDFLAFMEKQPKELIENCTVVVLTSVTSENKIEKAKGHFLVNGLISKPIKQNNLEQILEKIQLKGNTKIINKVSYSHRHG